MEEYIVSFIYEIPTLVYVGIVTTFCLGCLITVILKTESTLHYVSEILFVEYLILIICSTLLFRTANDAVEHNFTPFWSYKHSNLLIENIMNVVVFVPVGTLLGYNLKNVNWWKVLLIGGGLSSIIEVVQYVSKRGFSEVDDVMHNTLGCLIGYGVYSLLRFGYRNVCKRRMVV